MRNEADGCVDLLTTCLTVKTMSSTLASGTTLHPMLLMPSLQEKSAHDANFVQVHAAQGMAGSSAPRLGRTRTNDT